MGGASALYAAQRFARWLTIPQEAVRLYGADHERITAHLRSTREGLRSALRGGGEAGLLLGLSSTEVLLNGVSLKKQPTNHSFAPRVHFWPAADRIFQGDRLGVWDRLAGPRFAGPAAVSAHRAGGIRAGSFHDVARAVRIDATTLEANAALGCIVRRHTKELYQELLQQRGKGPRIESPTRERLARLDRKRPHKGSNEGWEHPQGPDAQITKMKDGRTHLGHKVEPAVDMASGAAVAVTLQPADQGDNETVKETLAEAGEEVGAEANRSGQPLEAVTATPPGEARAQLRTPVETGGIHRARLRRHPNILKRLLVHVLPFNLGLVIRKVPGRGTPRGLQGRPVDLAVILLCLLM